MEGCDGAVADRRPPSAEEAQHVKSSQRKGPARWAGGAPVGQAHFWGVPSAQATHGWLGESRRDEEIQTDHCCSLLTGRVQATVSPNGVHAFAPIGRRVHESR